jgi:hypothetical protein
MSAPNRELLLLIVTGLIVAFRIYFLIARLWNRPMQHGPGFFLEVEVAPGFYDGPGVHWLKRYHGVVLAEHLIEAAALAALFAWDQLDMLPVWAGCSPLLFLPTMFGLSAWARRALGPSQPPARSSIAVSLETRRLGDYISWPQEALMAFIIVGAWLLLWTQGDAHFRWQYPFVPTYLVAGFLPFKIFLFRAGRPLPAEQTEEHQRWFEAMRRHSGRVLDSMRWIFLMPLVGYALMHGLPGAEAISWLRWLGIGVTLGIWLYMVLLLIRDGGRLATMGRNLRPVGNWAGLSQPSRWVSPAGLAWSLGFFGGLILMLVFFPG